MSVAPLREPSATPNSGSVTATEDQELVFGAGRTLGTFTTPRTNFTSRITPTSEMVEDMFVTATGSYSATPTLSGSAACVMEVAAFRSAEQAPTGTDIVTQHNDVQRTGLELAGNGPYGIEC